MRQLYVVFFDTDEEYLQKLSSSLSDCKSQPYVVEVYWTKEKLISRLMDGRPIDLFVGSEQRMKEAFEDADQSDSNINLSNIIKQLERAQFSEILVNDPKFICKYQSIDRINKQILRLLPEEGVHFPMNNLDSVKAIAIYSPASMPARSVLAMDVTKKYNGLYLGMEEFDSFSKEKSEEHHMGKLLFYIKSKKKNIALHTELLASQTDGFKMIHSPTSYLDLRELCENDMNWYLNQMRDSHIFPFIIADIGCGALSDLRVLNCFDRIIVPVPIVEQEDELATNRLNSFYECLNQLSLSEVKSKVFELPISYQSGVCIYTECQLNQAIYGG